MAIVKLQDASFELDEEKIAAEKAFRKALKNVSRWRDPHVVRKVIQWIKERLGIGAEQEPPRLGALKWLTSVTESPSSEADICESRSKGKGPLCDFIRAAKAVRVVNQKLSSFERGFISEGGIKDREWYKHLGVAPGKHTGKPFFWFLCDYQKSQLCIYRVCTDDAARPDGSHSI